MGRPALISRAGQQVVRKVVIPMEGKTPPAGIHSNAAISNVQSGNPIQVPMKPTSSK